jgi:SAM-dependent methyltransferase
VADPVARLLLGAARAHSWVTTQLWRSNGPIGAVLEQALTPEERTELTLSLYAASPYYGGSAMFDWEERWFATRLPSPPARVIVGGCGRGREVHWLRARGYDVDAFDPSDLAERAVEGAGPIERASYQDLARVVVGGEPDALRAGFLRPPYAAFLFGWGSLVHLLEPRDRSGALAAADVLTPSGPILASFYLARTDPPEPTPWRRGGARLGRAIGRVRGVRAHEPARSSYTAGSGFAVELTRDEVVLLGAEVGREVVFEHRGEEFPHATFLAGAARGGERSVTTTEQGCGR